MRSVLGQNDASQQPDNRCSHVSISTFSTQHIVEHWFWLATWRTESCWKEVDNQEDSEDTLSQCSQPSHEFEDMVYMSPPNVHSVCMWAFIDQCANLQCQVTQVSQEWGKGCLVETGLTEPVATALMYSILWNASTANNVIFVGDSAGYTCKNEVIRSSCSFFMYSYSNKVRCAS